MNPYFFSQPTQRDVYEFAPKLTDEFDRLYIQTLTLKYCKEQRDLRWRIWLSHLGTGLIGLGQRVQHLAHLPFAVRHTSWKVVAMQSIKVRHHR